MHSGQAVPAGRSLVWAGPPSLRWALSSLGFHNLLSLLLMWVPGPGWCYSPNSFLTSLLLGTASLSLYAQTWRP